MSTLKIRLGRVKGSIWYTGTADSNTAIATALTSAGYTPIKLDMYMNTSNGNVYQYLPLDDGLQWVLQGNLRGTIGPEGLQGRGYYRANVKIDVSATTTSRANINPTNCRLLISDTIVDNVGNYFAVTANCEIGDATIKIAHRGYIGGKDGVDGLGVPSGGSTGQVLTKLSDADNDTAWKDPSGGGAGISVDVSEYYNAEENTLDIPYNTFVSLYNKFVEGATVQLVLKKTKTHQDSSTTIYYILRFVGACKYAEKSLETDEAASITYVTFSIQPYDFDYQPVVQYVQTAYTTLDPPGAYVKIPLSPRYGLVKLDYDPRTYDPIALKAKQDEWGNDIAATYYKKPESGIPESDLSEEVQAKLNSGGAENLLKGDVTVTVADGSLNILVELGYPLGISADKSYKVVVEYNGEIKDILIKSSDWQKNETAVAGIVSINSAVRIVVADGISGDYNINPDNACLGIDRTTSGSLTIIFKSITEYTEVVADKVQNKLTITVNGEAKEYDGSGAVEVDINTGSNAENLIKTARTTTEGEFEEGLSSGMVILDFALNLQVGKKYTIKYKHEGVSYEATAEAWNTSGMIVIGSFDSGSGHKPIDIIPGDENSGIIFIIDNIDWITQQTGDKCTLAMVYTGGVIPSVAGEFISITEVEETPETYKIKQVSVTEGETISSVVTKITNAVAEELTAQGKTSAIVAVVFNNLMIADSVSSGSANNRAFIETFNQACTSRVTADTMFWATPLVNTYASDNELWGTMSSIAQVQFGKVNSSVIVSTGGRIGTTGPDFADLSNFVADGDVTIDLIFY